MPLSFNSESHGNIAFGFFNIESDMLLLENHFFFADRFCEWIIELAGETQFSDPGEARGLRLRGQAYQLAGHDIGDLMGAIHGVRFTGFIGTLYKRFPFPSDPENFKQNPKGYETQKVVTREIEKFSTLKAFSIEVSSDDQVHLGPYCFSRQVFIDMILYVLQGGYPRWKEEIRPDYVSAMKFHVLESRTPFFQGIIF